MLKPKILTVVAVCIVIIGFAVLPFMDFAVDGEPVPVNGQQFWFILIPALIALFVKGKKRGWYWTVAGILGLIALVGIGLDLKSTFTEVVNSGFYNVTVDDILAGNAPQTHTITNMAFGSGFYVPILGLIGIVACGIWDIVQQRKPQNTISEGK